MTARSDRTAHAIIATGLMRSLAAGSLCVAALLLCLALGACGASASPSSRPAVATAPVAAPQAPCGVAAAAAAAQASGLAASHIYALERSSVGVRAVQRQVEGYAPLLRALAAGNRAAVAEAVTALVYSHTHIVRLRVTSAAGVVADVGGPFILAPVGGTLRLGGRTLGRYLLSVQDDSGYVKLEQRYVGHAVLMRLGGRVLPVEGALGPGAGGLPERGPASYRGTAYELYTLHALAFPSGALRITLLVPRPRDSTLACGAIRLAELQRIGQRIWRRFAAVSAPPSGFVREVASITGALAYVRAGSRQIAGSTRPGPPRLPAAGSVRYHGVTFQVSSFAARTSAGPARVYQLLRP